MKTIEELLFIDDSAINIIKEWINSSNNKNEAIILPREERVAIEELIKLQLTTKSILGAVAYHTGGITLQNGWLRILGSGNHFLNRTITSWTDHSTISGLMLIGDDIIGGFFALNGGYLPYDVGKVFYLAPDTLEWESLERTYSEFLHWTITGNLNEFYEPFRWSGWNIDILSIKGNQGFSFYPFLWSKESRNIDNCSRKIVDIEEIWKMTIDFQKNLNSID